MSTIWQKIRFTDRMQTKGFSTSLQIPSSWPETTDDVSSLRALKNPNKATKWRTADTPSDIVFYLQLRNCLHFGEAQGTPFTTPLLKHEVDWAANSTMFELILEGQYSN
eukprot:1277610-Ditylum_brightwellii.AAC.1